MRYQIRQQLFSFGDDFHIENAGGKNVFFVDGKALSFGHQLSFQDLAGNELAYIQQQVLSWGPTYEPREHGGDRHGLPCPRGVTSRPFAAHRPGGGPLVRGARPGRVDWKIKRVLD